jgi:hypothetical protein
MKIEDVGGVGAQLSQILLASRADVGSCVSSVLWARVELGCDPETAFLPPCLSSERLLLSSDIAECCVHLPIPLSLETIQNRLELAKICNSGALFLGRTKCHQSEDDLMFQHRALTTDHSTTLTRFFPLLSGSYGMMIVIIYLGAMGIEGQRVSVVSGTYMPDRGGGKGGGTDKSKWRQKHVIIDTPRHISVIPV